MHIALIKNILMKSVILNWKIKINTQNIGGYFYYVDIKLLPVFGVYDKVGDAFEIMYHLSVFMRNSIYGYIVSK